MPCRRCAPAFRSPASPIWSSESAVAPVPSAAIAAAAVSAVVSAASALGRKNLRLFGHAFGARQKRLAREIHAALAVDLENLHVELVAFLDDVLDALDPS